MRVWEGLRGRGNGERHLSQHQRQTPERPGAVAYQTSLAMLEDWADCLQRVAGSSKSLRQEMDKKGKVREGKRWGAETKTTQ